MSDRELLEKAAKCEEVARRAAQILGEHSATAKAVSELDRIRATGQPAAIVMSGSTWVVVRAAAAIGGKT